MLSVILFFYNLLKKDKNICQVELFASKTKKLLVIIVKLMK